MAVALGGRPIETFTGRPGMIARSAACWTLLALVACAPTRGQGDVAAAEEARPTTTVVLVRHAEKAAEPAQDPPLTEAGAARARALLDALADARVNAIYSTNYARTRDTAQPLSDAAGVPVTVISDTRNFIPQVAERIRADHAGDVVVVVGHSNTIGSTIEALGGTNIGDLPDEAYDRFFVVLLQDGAPTRVIQSRFGAPTP